MLMNMCRLRDINEQAFDKSQGPAPVTAFFCIPDSVVVVVSGVGSSAVFGWQIIFGVAVVVARGHHVGIDAVVSEACV
jgi:hypothetical protein